jgi:hypothetical protein
MPARRFPPPWSVEEQPACFVVKDRAGQKLVNSLVSIFIKIKVSLFQGRVGLGDERSGVAGFREGGLKWLTHTPLRLPS